MSIPLDQIISNTDNIYEKTTIAILEAKRIAKEQMVTGDTSDEKIAIEALNHAMNNEVELATGDE